MNFISVTFAWMFLFLFGSCNESIIPISDEDVETVIKSESFLFNDVGTLAGELTDDEIESLLYMYEEEKMARDVYQYFFETYQRNVFSNITASEQSHMDAVKMLIDGYGIENELNDEAGVFLNTELASIYQALIEQGNSNLEEALRVGAYIEEYDIEDLIEWKKIVLNDNVLIVYNNLQAGSENHLRAFTRNLSSLGVVYEPKLLEDSFFEQIISETNGQGRGRMGR